MAAGVVRGAKQTHQCDGGFESAEPGLHARKTKCDLAKTTTPESDFAGNGDAKEEEDGSVK